MMKIFTPFETSNNKLDNGSKESEPIKLLTSGENKAIKEPENNTGSTSPSKTESIISRRFKGDHLMQMLATQQMLQEKKAEEIKDQEAIIYQNGIPLIFPNTIVLIQGKMATNKSRVAGAIASSILKNGSCDHVPLGLKAVDKDMQVVLVDTERNLSSQLPKAIQVIQNCACIPKEINPPNFDYTSLLPIPRADRFKALKKYIEHIKDEIGDKHIVILLDIISDLVKDYNSPSDSLELSDYLNDLINTEDCTIVAVLHENPSKNSFKARGALGTEVQNKASTVIQVSLTNPGIVQVAILKSRNTAIPDPVFAQYDNRNGGLVIVDSSTVTIPKNSTGGKADLNDVMEYLGKTLKTPMLKKDLYNLMETHFKCSERTIDVRLKEIHEGNIMIPTAPGGLELAKEKRDNGFYYFLKEPAMPSKPETAPEG